MAKLQKENIEWAVNAKREGRSLEFIASVLEVSTRRVETILRVHGDPVIKPKAPRATVNSRFAWRASPQDNSEAKKRAEALFSKEKYVPHPNPDGRGVGPRLAREDAERISQLERGVARRKFLLCMRFARHWDMIWFLRRERMSGRSLRQIYGAECLIWAHGGGIHADLDAD